MAVWLSPFGYHACNSLWVCCRQSWRLAPCETQLGQAGATSFSSLVLQQPMSWSFMSLKCLIINSSFLLSIFRWLPSSQLTNISQVYAAKESKFQALAGFALPDSIALFASLQHSSTKYNHSKRIQTLRYEFTHTLTRFVYKIIRYVYIIHACVRALRVHGARILKNAPLCGWQVWSHSLAAHSF